MGWRADIESHDVMQFLGKGLVIRQFEAAPAVRCKAVLVPDLDDRRGRDPDALAIARTVQCEASSLGISSVSVAT